MGIGDWGLGIGPIPQSPIPNPQSPIPKLILNWKKYLIKIYLLKLLYKYFKIKNIIIIYGKRFKPNKEEYLLLNVSHK